MKFIITSSLLFISIVLLSLFSCNSSAQSSAISVAEFEKGIAQKDIQILDVRTAEEYNSGHIANTLQADWNDEAVFKTRVASLDKLKPVFTYCLSGGRSGAAMQWLTQNGFKTVYNLKGGINAWKQANKPLEAVKELPQMTLQAYQNLIPLDKTVLVDVGAEWCPPCKKMKPVLDSLEKEKFTVIKIDGGSQTFISKQLKIDAFPVFIVYKNGKEIARREGIQTFATLKKLLL
jgi:rhodanese-related sulfurtransferase